MLEASIWLELRASNINPYLLNSTLAARSVPPATAQELLESCRNLTSFESSLRLEKAKLSGFWDESNRILSIFLREVLLTVNGAVEDR
jgi:hypothetical protein